MNGSQSPEKLDLIFSFAVCMLDWENIWECTNATLARTAITLGISGQLSQVCSCCFILTISCVAFW